MTLNRVSRDEIAQAASERRERIKEYMMGEVPLSVQEMIEREGMTERALWLIIRDIEKEHDFHYGKMNLRKPPNALPYGLTNASLRLRQKLADSLYLYLERGTDSKALARNRASFDIGLNNRAQLRAQNRPFAHDWKLSEIERLARALNREPREFLLSCLTG